MANTSSFFTPSPFEIKIQQDSPYGKNPPFIDSVNCFVQNKSEKIMIGTTLTPVRPNPEYTMNCNFYNTSGGIDESVSSVCKLPGNIPMTDRTQKYCVKPDIYYSSPSDTMTPEPVGASCNARFVTPNPISTLPPC
jgi:hypothetical protein